MKKGIVFTFLVYLLVGFSEKALSSEYNILAIRVEFPFEDPDHETTSGQGSFETDTSVLERYYNLWDVPPHDKLYFENHLRALNNYWKTVSEDSITIFYKVLPEDSTGAYKMVREDKFYKYGNGRTKEQTYQKLVDLIEEAVNTCKQKESSNIDFSAFDTVMIFHAGIGRETSYNIINDIPSAYISGEDIINYLDSSLVIDSREIDHVIVVPEMASSNGLGGLNGILVQMFGYRLGLPSFSNNKYGMPAAGGWCMMDTGAMALGFGTRGFVPTHPCIWSKIELGWLEPLMVSSDTTVTIAATHIKNDLPRGVKVPISRDEYLLIENRYNYAPRDSILASAVITSPDSSAVWIKADHYDAYIPGPGILIWHVNDRIIREKRADGAVNDDIYRRGLYLLEADGRQDIGSFYGRADFIEGHKDDTFKLNGKSILYPDPEKYPNSGSMWGANTGITVKVLSVPGDSMKVAISFKGNMKGFPVSVGANGYVTAADLDGDNTDELIVTQDDSLYIIDVEGNSKFNMRATGHPSVYYDTEYSQNCIAVPSDGTVRIIGADGQDYKELKQWTIKFEHGFIAGDGLILTREILSETSLLFAGRFVDNGVTVSSNIYTINPSDLSWDIISSFPDTVHVNSFSVSDDYIVASGKNNTLYFGNRNDTIDAIEIHGPILADLDRKNGYETIVTADRSLLIYQSDGSCDTVILPDNPVGEPVVADIDEDGFPEIIQCTETSVCAFRQGGVPVDRFPFRLPPGDVNEKITSPPIVDDIDGDGRLDIACATSNMRMVSYDPTGMMTGGFPIALTGEVTNSPLVFRRANSNSIALAYLTTEGKLVAYDLGITSAEKEYCWPMWKGGAQLTSALPNSKLPSEVKTTAPFEFYCYPNPITGNTGTFRITLAGATDCTITLYTVDGISVFERYIPESAIIPGVPNEVNLPSSKLASGLYIARIKTRQKTVTYKVGVLK